MVRWSLPTLRQARHHVELEALLAQPRNAPDAKSVALLIQALQQTLNYEFSALEALDRKAGVLLAAVLGIGFLNADRLKFPTWPAVIPFVVAVFFSLAAVGACLVVFWSRPLLTGPKPIQSAQATSFGELPFSQSVADSLAVAAQENANVNEVKGSWLNIAFTAATIAVIAFVILGLMGGSTVVQDQAGASPSQSATTSQQTTPTVQPPTTDAPSAPSAPPSEPAFVHPQLGVMEIRESWTPDNARPALPRNEGNDRG